MVRPGDRMTAKSALDHPWLKHAKQGLLRQDIGAGKSEIFFYTCERIICQSYPIGKYENSCRNTISFV